MRHYTAYSKKHPVYDERSEVPDSLVVKPWRDGFDGDWIEADDGCVLQVLKRRGDFITTCTGTIKVSDSAKMDTERRDNIHHVSGKTWYRSLHDREKPTQKEVFFAKLISNNVPPVEAYLTAFNTKSEKYAKKKSAILMKTERIQKIVREELKEVFGKLEIDLPYLVGSAKGVVDNAKSDSDRLRALNMLWDAFGVVEQKAVTEVQGIFQGITPEELESAERPKLG